MTCRSTRLLLSAGAALALAACGGAGGGVTAISAPPVTPTPIPTPTPTPTPTPASAGFFKTSPASQEFAVAGATFSEVAFPKYDGPLTGGSEQLRIRYDATAGKYEILEPQTNAWRNITPLTNTTPIGLEWTTGSTGTETRLHIVGDSGDYYPSNLYSYSALVTWYNMDGPGHRGVSAFGVASDPSAIPVSGSAVFNGSIFGYSNESWDWADWGRGLGLIGGKIQLTFNFSLGSLSGSMSPTVWVNDLHDLPELSFAQTVYSKGNTVFSGKFDTSLTGANMFSGLFTGPQANELIGNFAFPYSSPENGKTYEAGGGFIAKKP